MWDERYASEDYAYGTEPNDFLREVAPRLPVGKTLCLGEGEGRNAVFLAGLGHRVTALDGSRVGLEKARRLAADRGVAIVLISSDMEELLAVSDRIAVMHEGRITGTVDREDFSEETIMRLAVASTPDDNSEARS